jgi:hypothetical protein
VDRKYLINPFLHKWQAPALSSMTTCMVDTGDTKPPLGIAEEWRDMADGRSCAGQAERFLIFPYLFHFCAMHRLSLNLPLASNNKKRDHSKKLLNSAPNFWVYRKKNEQNTNDTYLVSFFFLVVLGFELRALHVDRHLSHTSQSLLL